MVQKKDKKSYNINKKSKVSRTAISIKAKKTLKAGKK
jgi:hypothetical protein